MITFFHPVSTFSNTGKTVKGRALQEMAMSFDRMLVHGDNAALRITLRMRELANVLDASFPRTRRTFIDCHIDRDGCGQISASPVNEGKVCLDQDYFRISFNIVDHAATIDEVLDRFTLNGIEKGGEK